MDNDLRNKIEQSKILDIPDIFQILLGKYDFDLQKEKNECHKVIEASMQMVNKLEVAKVFDYLMEIKESIKPYRSALAAIEPHKKYFADMKDGQLVLSENDMSKIESQKEKLKMEGNQTLGFVSGGFIANFIHNFKAGSQLGQKIEINLQEKFGDNKKETERIDLNVKSIENQGIEISNTEIAIENISKTDTENQLTEQQHLTDFNEFKTTLEDIFKSNVQTLNKSKCYNIDFQTFKKFNSVGLNLAKASDSFVVGLIEGQTTSSISVNLFDGNGKMMEKELSYKLSGTLEKPSISISTLSQKYNSLNSQQNIKRTVLKGSKVKSIQKI
jgi:hypothetical protein